MSGLSLQQTNVSMRLNQVSVYRNQEEHALNWITTGQLTLIALVIIASVGIGGLLPAGAVGGCAIGLSIPLLLSSIMSKNKFDIGTSAITSVALVALGALVLSGILPVATAYWGIFGTSVGAFVFKSFACCSSCPQEGTGVRRPVPPPARDDYP